MKTIIAKDFNKLVQVWEASVRATHNFITESDILALKPAVLNEYLPALNVLQCEGADGEVLGFIGVLNEKIEMLFIAPEHSGKGIGKLLLNEAVNNMGALTLDVNEQNPNALGFYKHMGFEAVGRSELDGQGNPYPLIHMRLKVR